MCDYSLEMYASRPAREGEQYQTSRFPSGSIGLTSPGDGKTAVCIACDTRLLLANIPAQIQLDNQIGPSESAVFIRLEHGAYRDGVAFANGRQVSLQSLGSGVMVSLAGADRRNAQIQRVLEAV